MVIGERMAEMLSSSSDYSASTERGRYVIDESYKFLNSDEAPYGCHQTTR
jgi:hypothetical protein